MATAEHFDLRVRPKEFSVVKETDWVVPEDWFIAPIPTQFSSRGPQNNGVNPNWFAFSRYTGAIHLLSSTAVSLLEKTHGSELVDTTEPVLHELKEAGLLLAPSEKRRVTVTAGKKTEVWLKVNDICQLACPGCFDGQANTTELKSRQGITRVMTQPIIDKVADETLQWSAKTGKEEVHYKIAGGEPALSPQVVRDFVTSTKEKRPEGVETTYSFVTNGVGMTQEFLSELKELGVHVAISIDGFGEDHDRVRHFRDGRGSFKKVWEALRMIKESGVSHNISTVINKYNVGNLGELAKAVYDEFGWTIFNLTFVRDNPSAIENLTPTNEQLVDGIRKFYAELYQAALRFGKPIQREGLLDYFMLDAARTHVCGASTNYLVYNSAGLLSSCHMLANTHGVDAGERNPFEIISQNHPVPLKLRDVDNTSGSCKSCDVRYQCGGGGCKLHQNHVFGNYDPKRPLYCEAYYTLGPEWMALKASIEYQLGPRSIIGNQNEKGFINPSFAKTEEAPYIIPQISI